VHIENASACHGDYPASWAASSSASSGSPASAWTGRRPGRDHRRRTERLGPRHVEQRLTPQITVTYVSRATSTQQQVIQVEYNISRELSIVALRDENGTFGLDVKRTKRFK
jgi:hypothetical protein